MSDPIELIAAQRVVPVLRTDSVEDAVATARACATAGMRVVELTRSTPGVERALEELAGDGLTLAVGTVTEPGQVREAVAAGASVIVSYAFFAEVVDAARRLDVPVIPGALTPSEVAAALAAGAAAVKLFPSRMLAPSYLRDVRTVIPDLRAVVTGGVRPTRESIMPWLVAGATAVGLGSELGTVERSGAEEVERRCREALTAAGAPIAPVAEVR